jgi:hypothetical protein
MLGGEQAPGKRYQASTSHLLVFFDSDATGKGGGFTATVSGGPSGCTPCKSGTYKADTNALRCTACPFNAVSAEGSTALSSCACPAGYTGDAGVGERCVPCEAGTYWAATASKCTACPPNTISAEGGAAISSCLCVPGYTGDVAGDCVSCEAGTYKDVSGPATCTICPAYAVSVAGASLCECAVGYAGDVSIGEVCVACVSGKFKDLAGPQRCRASSGSRKRAWMDAATGLSVGGPPARTGFGCAEAGGKVYLFGGQGAGSGEDLPPANPSELYRAFGKCRFTLQGPPMRWTSCLIFPLSRTVQ